MAEYLIDLHEVRARTSLGRSTIYAMVKSGTFPAPVKVGGKSIRWRANELAAWIDGLDRTTNIDEDD